MALLATPLPHQLNKETVGNLGKGILFQVPIGLCRNQHLLLSEKTGCGRLLFKKLPNRQRFHRDLLTQFLFKTRWSTLPPTLLCVLQNTCKGSGYSLAHWQGEAMIFTSSPGSCFSWQLRAAHVPSSVTLQNKGIWGGGCPNFYTFDLT